MKVRALIVVGFAALSALAPTGTGAAPEEGTQASSPVESAVTRALRDELEVSTDGTEVTLRGTVPHLYAKNRAIELALEVEGVETVASEIELPEPESDQDIAEQVVRVVNRYAHYTLWDHLDGSVNQGVVTLYGSVTPNRDKKGDLYTQIARIQGVQDYIDNIEIQSPSSEDIRLRNAISRNLFRSEHFERFRTMRNPPFHIVVNRSVVTLVGYVQSEIEYREMERIIAQMGGVLRIDNQLVVTR